MIKKIFQKVTRSLAFRLLAGFLVIFLGISAAFWLQEYREAEVAAKKMRQDIRLLREEVVSIGFGMGLQLKNFEKSHYTPFMEGLKGDEQPLPKMYYSWYAALETADWQALIDAGGRKALDEGLVENLRYYKQNLHAVVKFADLLTQNCIDKLGPQLVRGKTAYYDQAGNLREEFGWYPFYLDRLHQAMTDLVANAQEIEQLLEEM